MLYHRICTLHSGKDQKRMAGKKTLGISQRAFAKKMGVTVAAVQGRIERGKLEGAVLADRSLNEELATRLWEENSADQMKRSAERESDRIAREGEYRIKLRQMEVNLETSEINLTRLKESTIDREQARLAGRAAMRALRDHMLNFANRYGASIAGELGTDPGTTMGLIDAKMRIALGEVSNTPNPYAAEPVFDE